LIGGNLVGGQAVLVYMVNHCMCCMVHNDWGQEDRIKNLLSYLVDIVMCMWILRWGHWYRLVNIHLGMHL